MWTQVFPHLTRDEIQKSCKVMRHYEAHWHFHKFSFCKHLCVYLHLSIIYQLPINHLSIIYHLPIYHLSINHLSPIYLPTWLTYLLSRVGRAVQVPWHRCGNHRITFRRSGLSFQWVAYRLNSGSQVWLQFPGLLSHFRPHFHKLSTPFAFWRHVQIRRQMKDSMLAGSAPLF